MNELRVYNWFISFVTGELEEQLDALKRCQSMEELRRLADSGQHSKVIDFLLPASATAKDLDVERMQLLQESIVASKEYRVSKIHLPSSTD